MSEEQVKKEEQKETKQVDKKPSSIKDSKKSEKAVIDEAYLSKKIYDITENFPNTVKELFTKIQSRNKEKSNVQAKDNIKKNSPEELLKYFNILSIRAWKPSDISICVLATLVVLLIFIRLLDLYYYVNIYFIAGVVLYTLLAIVRRYIWK